MKNIRKIRQIKLVDTLLALSLLLLFSLVANNGYGQSAWIAHSSANSLKNPYKDNTIATAAGKELYKQFCAICHGDKGKGDGLAGMSLKPRPANFKKKSLQMQTDGAIFWKITEGRAPMAPYKSVLTDQQRWQLVNYIRQLGGH